MIRLYQGCTACREEAYERLKSRLESDSQSRELIALIDREEFSDAPLQLSRALIRSGSPLEARTIALREMDKATFVEERLDWIEVLAEIHFQLGEVKQGKRLVQRLRERAGRDDRAHAVGDVHTLMIVPAGPVIESSLAFRPDGAGIGRQ